MADFFQRPVQLLPQPVAEDHFMNRCRFASFIRGKQGPARERTRSSRTDGRDQHSREYYAAASHQLHRLMRVVEEALALEGRHFAKTRQNITGTAVVCPPGSGVRVIGGT